MPKSPQKTLKPNFIKFHSTQIIVFNSYANFSIVNSYKSKKKSYTILENDVAI